MSKYTVILCILTLFWLFLGIRAVTDDFRKRSHILFGLMCLTMTIWTLFLGAAYSLEKIDSIILFLKIAYIGGFLFSPVNLHLYLAASNTSIRWYHTALNYIPYLFLMISNFAGFFVFSGFVRHNNEWMGILNTGSIRFKLYLLFVVLTFIISFAVILAWNIRTKVNKEKIQSLLILILYTSTYFTSMLLTMILPLFDIHKYQHIGIILFSMYVIGLYFLIVKIKFMNIDRATSADEIFSNINEHIFILDNDFRITDINSAASANIPVSADNFKKRPFPEIVIESTEFIQMAGDIRDDKIKNFRMIIHYRSAEGDLPARAYVSGIRDRFNDISGFLVIVDYIKEIHQFKKIYRITSRELEIVSMTVAGSSYREIAEKLLISERTVERHLTNIYNKLGINNKIELYRIAGEYNFKM